MYQPIEVVMLKDFVFDFMLLFTALSGVSRIRFERLMLAAFLGSVFTCAMVLLCSRTILRLPVIITAAFLITCISVGSVRPGKFFICVCRLLAASGLLSALCQYISFHWSAISMILLLLIFRISQSRCDIHRICSDFKLNIVINGIRLSAVGIIDTGNRLTEPISGLPVLILSSGCFRNNSEFEADFKSSTDHSRQVPFGGIGGNGMMTCYMPDKIFLSSGNDIHELFDMWVAVYEGNLPGGHEALLPPETIRYIKSNCKRRRILCPGTDR